MIRKPKVEFLQFELKLQLESAWINQQNGLGSFERGCIYAELQAGGWCLELLQSFHISLQTQWETGLVTLLQSLNLRSQIKTGAKRHLVVKMFRIKDPDDDWNSQKRCCGSRFNERQSFVHREAAIVIMQHLWCFSTTGSVSWCLPRRRLCSHQKEMAAEWLFIKEPF